MDACADSPFWFERPTPLPAVNLASAWVPAPAQPDPPCPEAAGAPGGDEAEFARRWSEHWERELDQIRAQRRHGAPARTGVPPRSPARTRVPPRSPARTRVPPRSPARTRVPPRSPARIDRGHPRRRPSARRRTRSGLGRRSLGVVVVLMCASAVAAWCLASWWPTARASTARFRPVVAEAQPRAAVVAPHTPASAYAERTIPRTWLRMYWQAGAEYGLDWTVLAAVGTLESDNGASTLPGVARGTNSAGVAGPAQFASGTWARYSVNVDPGRAPGPSRYDAADAITTMAAYLKASGAPQDWPAALYAYNHSTAYVRTVLALAARYRG